MLAPNPPERKKKKDGTKGERGAVNICFSPVIRDGGKGSRQFRERPKHGGNTEVQKSQQTHQGHHNDSLC